MVRSSDKIIEGLSLFLEGYIELQKSVEDEFGSDSEYLRAEEEDDEVGPEVEAALVTEIRATVESVMDAEDYSGEEFASAVSILTDALEEIDPDLFEQEEEEEEEEEVVVDDDIDYDDDYEDLDEEDEDDDDDDEDE